MKIEKFGFTLLIEPNNVNTVSFEDITFSWIGPILSDLLFEIDMLNQDGRFDYDDEYQGTDEENELFFQHSNAARILRDSLPVKYFNPFMQTCMKYGYDRDLHGNNFFMWWMHHMGLEIEIG